MAIQVSNYVAPRTQYGVQAIGGALHQMGVVAEDWAEGVLRG